MDSFVTLTLFRSEPNGVLLVNERGLLDGQVKVVQPHANFRLIMAMNPQNGEISRAMRNRVVEICVLDDELERLESPENAIVLDRDVATRRALMAGGLYEPKAVHVVTMVSDKQRAESIYSLVARQLVHCLYEKGIQPFSREITHFGELIISLRLFLNEKEAEAEDYEAEKK